MKNNEGVSLLEILVVASVFALLGILITRAVLLTLGGGKKSESLIKIRENLNYSIAVIERQLRNANSIITCGENVNTLSYTDRDGTQTSFSCVSGTNESNGYIASGSSILSADTINVTSCSFTCATVSGVPTSVTIDLEATDAEARGIENSVVSAKTQILLRNY